jgi:hypothetical protein
MSNVVPLRNEGEDVDLSAIVPVTNRFDDPDAVYWAYRTALQATGKRFELIYVFDTPVKEMLEALRALQGRGEPITIVELSQAFGESVCVSVGLQRARGDAIFVLPPFLQIAPEGLTAMSDALQSADVVAACRDRRRDHWLNRARGRVLQRLAYASGSRMADLGCLVRAFRRRVLDEVPLHDEHYRFLPLLAQHAGFVVQELTLEQADSDREFRHHRPSAYIGRSLDLIALAFLLRFMQRPFRFFGTVGSLMAALGLILGSMLVVQRMFYGMPLADRPALLLAALLVVLGIQIGAVGLIAEIIIFTRSRNLSTFRVDRIVERDPTAEKPSHDVHPPTR